MLCGCLMPPWSGVYTMSSQGEGDAVRLLITAGCDFTIKDNDGETPLMVAKGKAKVGAAARGCLLSRKRAVIYIFRVGGYFS